jgi:hypothetical protein
MIQCGIAYGGLQVVPEPASPRGADETVLRDTQEKILYQILGIVAVSDQGGHIPLDSWKIAPYKTSRVTDDLPLRGNLLQAQRRRFRLFWPHDLLQRNSQVFGLIPQARRESSSFYGQFQIRWPIRVSEGIPFCSKGHRRISRSFPDGRPLGSRFRVPGTRLPSRRTKGNDFPALTGFQNHCLCISVHGPWVTSV